MEIAYLADRPGDLDRIALWQYGEWGYLDPEDSPGKRRQKLGGHLHRNSLPITLVALDVVHGRREAVGAADLVHQDLPARPDLTPWLSCVYVAPERRGRGIGSTLTRRAVVEAARLGAPTLYLCTWDRESFYRELGWTTLERFTTRGRAVSILEIET